ncbi:50S ribosomal protein L15 [Candidatus Falkowbacteria bacterium CG10_big_fil_rev_8_21_14_0_10_37_6]|uniref:Large ribosomal subunit protein uL15 n=1 Tax=Candidatus Falkowbacteria bacterium CG10_big_fil_rev_8_21_14_0_10_37_6 TaxID=1974563 RepID=A0A2H0V9P1_9BACT|nr:MAG: 50S ribosomal protein L15 [Candidatus Falkowbacteria bacterium CG10_big_fil_rev_8_21_14_0_10_37_6]
MLSLHTIKPNKGATKKRKRVGRGNASGHGTYSGRGLKGQKSRSGGKSGLKRKGMKNILLQTPKLRGFKSDKPKNQVVNIFDINNNFKDKDAVNPSTLMKNNLIVNTKDPIKILGKGDLKIKNLTVEGVKMSESVKSQIEKNGGKIMLRK